MLTKFDHNVDNVNNMVIVVFEMLY